MSQSYFLKRADSVRGPFSLAKMQTLLTEKKIKPNDLVAVDRKGPWQRLRAVHKDIRAGIPPVFDTETKDHADESTDPEFDFSDIAELESQGESLGTGKVEKCVACGESVVENTEQCPYCGEPHLKLKNDALNSQTEERFVPQSGSGPTLGGGGVGDIVMHSILALLCSGLSGLLCGCFGFIPMLWFAFRNHQRGEIEIGVIYAVGALVSVFIGPWIWWLLFGATIVMNG